MNNKIIFPIIAIIVAIIFLANMLFVVEQTEQAVIFQFGQPVKVVKEPGLNVKMPFIQNVLHFDSRLQEINTEDKEVIAYDQKRLIINAFVKYKIVDPVLYYTTVRDENGFNNNLTPLPVPWKGPS